MGLKETVKQLLIKKIEYDYEKLLSRKKVSYDTWVRNREKADAVLGVEQAGNVEKAGQVVQAGHAKKAGQAGNTAGQRHNSAGGVDHTSQNRSFILKQQKNGKLNIHANVWIERFFAENPQVQILYGAEDFLTEQGIRQNPWYKPCWSPDLYLSQFYFGSVIAIRKSFYETLRGERRIEDNSPSVFEKPEEIRPFLKECIRIAGGFQKHCNAIAVCPQVLFHVRDDKVWESYLNSKEVQDVASGGKISDYEGQAADNSSAGSAVKNRDTTVIIPSKDNPQILRTCLDSLRDIPNLEIIVVDNGSCEENRRKIEDFIENLQEVTQSSNWQLQYLYEPMEFNFSRMCNMGAEAATGKCLLFLNDDIEACGTEWITAMKEKAAKPYVGAVGLKLYYPDSIKIQHAGITNLPVGPVHKMQFAEDDKSIYFDRNRAQVNCLAVTGACLMIEKEKYLEVGGFKEALRVAYNDVDLGFALYEAGYQNVVLNDYFAYHHESLSRGDDASKEKQARLMQERNRLYELHPALQDKDPYYPEGLSRDGLDSRVVPGYISALNVVQEGEWVQMPYTAEQIREDKCLFVGLEQGDESCIKGYGVVLGDNNACYDRYVVLAKEDSILIPSGNNDVPLQTEEGRKEAGFRNGLQLRHSFVIQTMPQYRQDLEENMPDQQNVALCGFHIHLNDTELSKLEENVEYRIGVLAVHKINKGKLLNWSGRYFKVIQ